MTGGNGRKYGVGNLFSLSMAHKHHLLTVSINGLHLWRTPGSYNKAASGGARWRAAVTPVEKSQRVVFPRFTLHSKSEATQSFPFSKECP